MRLSQFTSGLLAACSLIQLNVWSATVEWHDTSDYSRTMLFSEYIVKPSTPGLSQNQSKPLGKALDGPFLFPDNADNDGGLKRLNSIFGIDLSHWSSDDPNCKKPFNPSKEIDFSTLSGQSIRFVYVKATQDVGYRDCRFNDYWNALGNITSNSDLRRGAYHFLTATKPGLQQAISYVRFRTQNGGFKKDELPSVLDLEWDKTPTIRDRWKGVLPDAIINSAVDWLNYVEKQSGKRPLVYTSNVWLSEHHFSTAQLARLKPYQLWIADYSQTRRAIESPSQPSSFSWALWQFTAGSLLTIGPQKPLDATIFKGTDIEFAKVMQIPSE